jgi:hypothetical protein
LPKGCIDKLSFEQQQLNQKKENDYHKK